MEQEPTIEELADSVYTLLWKRNATKMGWVKFSHVRRIMYRHLPDTCPSRLRSVFQKLFHRGHFLKRTLVQRQHCSYLFLQNPIPVGDVEARARAIEHYRWQSNFAQS